MPMEDNINDLFRMRQELTIRNDDLTAQVRQLTKKVEILQSQRDSITAERDTYFEELKGIRDAVSDVLAELIQTISDKEKIKLIIKLSRKDENE
jgi:uncharacterized protein (UPF0335 family)